MNEWKIETPISEEVRKLKLGDWVYVDGTVVSWRDRAYIRSLERREKGEKPLPIDVSGMVHWHLGPIVRKVGEKWEVASAGPTTSARFTKVEPIAIKEWGIRLVVGKGGMYKETVDAMKEYGAAYLAAVGGAASLYAKKIVEIKAVYWLELGMTDAIWVLQVRDFGPLLVAIDSHGNNLYYESTDRINRNLLKIYDSIGIDPDFQAVWWGGHMDRGPFKYPI